jgi:hypothetical protein
LGAVAAFAKRSAAASKTQWTERRDLYPEGVASVTVSCRFMVRCKTTKKRAAQRRFRNRD